MAVLPDADSVGQIDTRPERKIGVGGWDTSVISRAANEEGAGLERLGGTMGDIGASIYNQAQQKQKEDEAKTNALQHAQATGALYTASTQAQLDAQNATDPNKVKQIGSGFTDLVPKIAATISDQNTRDMWVAQNTPHVAEMGGRLAGRVTELTNNNALANFATSANTVIGSAAKIDDDAASAKALDSINPQIQALVAAGAIRPQDAPDMRQKAAQQWAYARRDYLEAKAEATKDPADIARYAHFSGAPPIVGPDGKFLPGYGPVQPGATSAPGQTAAVTPPGGDPALAARIQAIKPTLPNEECVTLVQKASGLPPVGMWARGANAVQNQLPIGTPVATFMDRAGNPSDRYDGGQGVGLPGNNTTHAGIVAGYTANGDLILWNQWKGSGGPVLTTYKRGDQGGGEKDANNYFAINVGAPGGPGSYPAMGGVQPAAGSTFPATSLPLTTPSGMIAYKARVAQIESQNGADPAANGNIYQFMGG